MSRYLPGVYKPGNRTAITADRRGNGSLGVACVEHVGHQLPVNALRPAHGHATLTRCSAASSTAFTDHGAFELREAAQKVDEHPTDWGACVQGFSQGLDGRAGTLDTRQDLQEVGQATGKPVELPDHNVVSLAKVVEESDQFRPVLYR
jgi:hypothetical protein